MFLPQMSACSGNAARRFGADSSGAVRMTTSHGSCCKSAFCGRTRQGLDRRYESMLRSESQQLAYHILAPRASNRSTTQLFPPTSPRHSTSLTASSCRSTVPRTVMYTPTKRFRASIRRHDIIRVSPKPIYSNFCCSPKHPSKSLRHCKHQSSTFFQSRSRLSAKNDRRMDPATILSPPHTRVKVSLCAEPPRRFGVFYVDGVLGRRAESG